VKPAAAYIVKCSTLWGALVSGLRLGATNDRITIAAVKSQAAIRAILEPCDPALIGDSVAGMLSIL
jgi:hypothetical protein